MDELIRKSDVLEILHLTGDSDVLNEYDKGWDEAIDSLYDEIKALKPVGVTAYNNTNDVVTDGLKHDGGKPRLSLVPAEAIEAIGTVMTHGAEKYGEASYRRVEPKRYRDALMRHICKWLKNPHGLDEDSGLPHLWHIITNAAFLCELDIPKHTSVKPISKKFPLSKEELDRICWEIEQINEEDRNANKENG